MAIPASALVRTVRDVCERREIVQRPSSVVQARWLLSLVGTFIIMIVAERLARAFAVVGAAGLVRYRANIDELKDAGVLLVALALVLCTGADERDTTPFQWKQTETASNRVARWPA